MIHRSWFYAIYLALLMTGCSGAASTDAPGTFTAEPTMQVVSTIGIVEVGTAESGTVEPETPIPPDQITPIDEPSATSIAPLPGGLNPTELKYLVLDEFPDFFFCDPDYYPVARADEMDLARERFPEIQANAELFNTILAHNSLSGTTSFTDEQILLIYRDYKRLNAIIFEVAGDAYRFQITVAKTEGEGQFVTGLIDANGVITIESQEQAFAMCPICLAAGTLIDTPEGSIAVQDLRIGMLVWTLDASGQRVAQPVLAVGSTVVPADHEVVHLVLSDRREVWVSPGHPAADGRVVGDLRVGDTLGGATIITAERVDYAGYATYDLLPAGDTGFYWANGVLMASTLKP